MAFAPIQIFTFGFPDQSRLEGRIADELLKLSDAGTIRIIDALAVLVDGEEVEVAARERGSWQDPLGSPSSGPLWVSACPPAP